MEVRKTETPTQGRKDDKKKGLPGGEDRQAHKECQLRLRPGCPRFNVQSFPQLTLSHLLLFRTVAFGKLSQRLRVDDGDGSIGVVDPTSGNETLHCHVHLLP